MPSTPARRSLGSPASAIATPSAAPARSWQSTCDRLDLTGNGGPCKGARSASPRCRAEATLPRRPGDCSGIGQEVSMSDAPRLSGRRIAILAADGFEKIELSAPLRAMQLAGAKVDIVSLRRGRIRGVNLHEPASRGHGGNTVQEADPAAYDALLIPGGFINPDLLRQSSAARGFVRS